MRVSPWLLVLLLVSCGGSGPAPPPVGDTGEACLPEACVEHPADWLPEQGEGYLSFTHPADPSLVASLSAVDMAVIVESNGGSWPSSPENVVRDLWALLAQDQPGQLDQVETRPDGSVVSRGRISGAVLWHLLVPVEGGPAAWALSVRAPNAAWEAHAGVFLDGLTLRPGS